MNSEERKTLERHVDELDEIRESLSHLIKNGVLEATSALINVSQAQTKLSAVLECVDR